MMRKFKIGDRVVIHKPRVDDYGYELWVSGMEKFCEREVVISDMFYYDGTCCIAGIPYWFSIDWLEKIDIEIKDKFDSEISLEDFL